MTKKGFMKNRIAILALSIVAVASLLCIIVSAAATGTHTPVTGVTVGVSGATDNSMSNGAVTVTAKGSSGVLGIGASAKTATITITNDSGSTAEISFDWTATSVNALVIDESTYTSTNGSFEKTMEAGASITITITTAKNRTTNKLVMSNFGVVEAQASSKVTFEYNEALGTVTVGGTAVSNGAEVDIPASGASVVAQKSGSSFLGWVKANGEIISTAESTTLVAMADMTVKAVFADSTTPWFGVGSKTQKSVSTGLFGWGTLSYYTVGTSYLFDDLNDAAAKAASEANAKCIVLMNSGTLSAGTYTIPSGVTLLIPFDSANTMYTTQVQNTTDTYVKPTEYRTLTMADGAKLELNGSMSVSAKQQCAQGSKANGGSPTGPVSFVKMQGNSNITVNNGGALYAYGFITGSGSVTANNGATVYEMFQFMDFRGGTQSTDMDNEVFPFSQYYVQNIEVPMTLEYGAMEYAYTTIYMSSADFGTAVNFIGPSDAMFKLTSGYAVKKYDGTTDRMMIEVNGNLSVSTVELSFGTSSINSKNYDLPINSNITVTAKSGSNVTLGQDLAFLPGSEMIIESGATCTLGSGINVYIYDADQWGNFTFSTSSVNNPFKPLTYAPGRIYNRTNADLVDATIKVNGTLDASKGCLYTTAGGANICSTGNGVVNLTAGTQTSTHQLVQGTKGPDGTTVTSGYVTIPLTPAQLKNANTDYEPYVTTAGRGTTAITYGYANGRWYSLAVNPTNANTDQTNISAKFRVEDYLWMNGSCYFGKVDAESVWADIATTNISVQTFNTTTKSWEDVTGYVDAVVINGEVYLVKKVLSDEIPKNITFRLVYTIKDGESITAQYLSVPITVNFMTYADAYIEANKNASADAVREDGVKVLDMVDLLKAMKTYGDAAEIYFDKDLKAAYNKDESKVVPDEITMTEAKDTAMSLTNGAESGVTGASLKTNSAKVYFDEALRMSVFFTPTGFDESKIVKIGLLASPGVLNDTGVLTAANHQTMYVLYSLTSPEIPGGSENYPDEDLKENVNNTVTSYNTLPATNDSGRWELCFDLTNEMYNEVYELRPFVIVEDETGTYYVYGEQVHYSLAAYISRTYAKSTDKAFKNLLTATWDYIVAADAAF